MNFIVVKYKIFIVLILTALAFNIHAVENKKTISCNMAWYAEGGERAPIKIEQFKLKETPAAKITFLPRKAWNKLYLPVKNINLKEYNTITFKYKTEIPDGAQKRFRVYLVDNKGNWSATSFAKHKQLLKNGELLFKWDALNEPDIVRGFNPEKLTRIGISYAFNSIPEGKKVILTIYDLKLHKGMKVITGDPDLFAKWQKYIKSYKPDYSDSSKYLQSSKYGRLKSPLTLYIKGKSQGEIIIQNKSHPAAKTAAEELKYWLQKIGGGTIEIRETASSRDNVKIFLGNHGKYLKDIKKLKNSDGYAVRNEGKNIYIFGSRPKGTLNGVFTFLENNTDIIWARPSPDFGTVFNSNPDLKIVWGNIIELPASRLRGWQPNLGGGAAFWEWCTRNRNNYFCTPAKISNKYGDFAQFGGGHNLQSFIPKGDSRYYPVIKGKKPEKLSIWKHQICLNAPDLVEVYARSVVKYVKNKAPEGINAVNIKIEDNWGVCECRKCLEPIKLPNGKILTKDAPTFRSTQFYNFLNQVTAQINKVYPNLKIQTYAYFYTAIAPDIKLNPNIYVLFCPYVRKDQKNPLCAPINDCWWKRINEWKEKTDNIIIREYFSILNGGRPVAEVVAFDTKNYLKRNIVNFTSEINPDIKRLWWDGALRGSMDEFDFNMMDYWIVNRLYWNPKLDIEQLRKYFIRRVFREAAPEMEKFFGRIREQWYKNTQSCGFIEGPKLIKQTVLKPGIENEMRMYLKKAAETARHPVSRILVYRVKKRFEEYIHEADTKKKKLTAEEKKTQKILYGWRSEGADAEVRQTTVLLDNKPASVLKAVFIKSPKARHIIINATKLGLKDTPVFSFIITPSKETAEMNLPLPEVLVDNKKWQRKQAPGSAYSKNPDGSYSFNWDISKVDFEWETANKLIFKYNYSKIPDGEKAVFYIQKIRLAR